MDDQKRYNYYDIISSHLEELEKDHHRLKQEKENCIDEIFEVRGDWHNLNHKYLELASKYEELKEKFDRASIKDRIKFLVFGKV